MHIPGLKVVCPSNAYDANWNRLMPVIGTNGLPTGEYTQGGKPYTGKVNRMYTQGNLLRGGDVIWDNIRQDSVIDDNDRMVLGNSRMSAVWAKAFEKRSWTSASPSPSLSRRRQIPLRSKT